jgi:aspartate aminotransferase
MTILLVLSEGFTRKWYLSRACQRWTSVAEGGTEMAMMQRLSKRVDSIAPSATLAVAEKARAMRERGIDVISFGAGEPDFDTPAHVRDEAIRALAAGDTKYPSPVSGKTPLREAVCAYLKRWCDLDYVPSQVCVSVGAKDSLHLAFSALLNVGDEVVIPVPYWVSYPDQVRLADGIPVFVHPADRVTLKVTATEIAAAITPRTRVFVLNSPSNPTGAVYSRSELESIARVFSGTDVIVVSDEIYHRLTFDGASHTSFATLPGMFERTLTVNGASKSFAMTGWRLGFAAGPGWLIGAIAKLQGQTTSGPTSFVQTATVAALGGPQDAAKAMRDAYQERGTRMCSRLNDIPGVHCPRPHGAFYCFPDVSKTYARLRVGDADAFAELVLERARVAIVSGTAFGCPTHVRLSFATSDRSIDEGLKRLAEFLQA